MWVIVGVWGCSESLEPPVREDAGRVDAGADVGDGSSADTGNSLRTLFIDTSGANPYLLLDQPSASIPGTVMATHGLDRLETGLSDSPSPLTVTGANNSFTATKSVEPGITVIPLRAYDSQEQMVKGHRAVLKASYLAEGERNPNAIIVAVTAAMLQSIGGNSSGAVSDLDLSPQFAPGKRLAPNIGCATFQGGSHGAPQLALTSVDGELQLRVTIPNLRVQIAGTCWVPLLGNVVTDGTITGDVVVTANLSSLPTPDGGCISGFSQSDATVVVDGFAYQRNSGRPLLDLLVRFISGAFDKTVGGLFTDQVEMLLNERLSNFPVMLPPSDPLDFFGKQLVLDMCITQLGSQNGVLVAQLAAGVSGTEPELLQAPGAPVLSSELPVPTSNKLYLDANLVGQLLYGAWVRGGIDQRVENDQIGFLLRDVEGLRELNPTSFTVDISAPLAPLVTIAEADSGSDLNIAIGELVLRFSADNTHILTVGSSAVIGLALEPNDAGGMVPKVTSVTSDVWVLDTPLAPLSEFKQGQVEDNISLGVLSVGTLSGLFGTLAIQLPDVGGPLRASEVTPLPGGMLEISLAP